MKSIERAVPKWLTAPFKLPFIAAFALLHDRRKGMESDRASKNL